jgi:hypothetical protein
VKLHFERKLQDCWIGVYWASREDGLHIWICLIPCFPLHIILLKEEQPFDEEAYMQFLEDTVDDQEYNAYLEHIHTPCASEY